MVVRVDGRSFTRLTASRSFEKPFDERFRDLMVGTAEALLAELRGLYAYTESDEISVLLGRGWDLFDRELEKVVSISAAIAASTFSCALGAPAQFDSRVWIGALTEDVVDYFRWRQEDAARGALNGWSYWTLRKAGLDVAEATARLDGAGLSAKKRLLRRHGLEFDRLPAWQRRGIGLWWERYEKEGVDPRSGKAVKAWRRRVHRELELPARDEYAALIEKLAGEEKRAG
jgi:tRNA(His) 5'-end guanylyltransferase